MTLGPIEIARYYAARQPWRKFYLLDRHENPGRQHIQLHFLAMPDTLPVRWNELSSESGVTGRGSIFSGSVPKSRRRDSNMAVEAVAAVVDAVGKTLATAWDAIVSEIPGVFCDPAVAVMNGLVCQLPPVNSQASQLSGRFPSGLAEEAGLACGIVKGFGPSIFPSR